MIKLAGFLVFLLTAVSAIADTSGAVEGGVRVGIFNVDVSPPIGSPVAYAPARKIVDPLSARGLVILSDALPVVLCAVDFIGIGNKGQDVWRGEIAKAVGTAPERVAVHALHQHDGCRCDFMIEDILAQHGLAGKRFDAPFLHDFIARTSSAAAEAAMRAQPVTHIGFGQAVVDRVASNRRVLGDDGKVKIVRLSRSTDPAAIAAPEGTIDPWLKCVSFWNEDFPVAVLTYYATHPQSYYGEGDVTCEFVGLARNSREMATGIPHIHFTGAAGNIAAGKYNDGSPENRPVLAGRMEAAMKTAWEATEKAPLQTDDIEWRRRSVLLPVASGINEDALQAMLSDPTLDIKQHYSAAARLAWLRRTRAARGIDLTALRLGNVWLLQLPGEPFVEYQLAAQALRPGDFVCTAGYGDIGPGYIGTEIAYVQGGYETGENSSFVAPETERVLSRAIESLLE